MKLINIILPCVLIVGIATSCGSTRKVAQVPMASKGITKGGFAIGGFDNSDAMAEKANPMSVVKTSKESGWIALFDGKTTAGWRGYNKPTFPEKGWRIDDGALQVIGSGAGEAGGGGDIIYDKKFSNFELSLEWKISEGGNSGIFILAQEIPDVEIYKSSLEMQVLDNDKHPDAKLGVDGNRMAGSLYDLLPAKPQNTKPVGEWNQVVITVYQGTVVFNQNGANVVEFHLWTADWKKMCANSKFKDWEWFINTAKEGYIGLQDHGNDVWFRNIKIKEL